MQARSRDIHVITALSSLLPQGAQSSDTCERAHAAEETRKREGKSVQRITGLAELHSKLGHATRETIPRTLNPKTHQNPHSHARGGADNPRVTCSTQTNESGHYLKYRESH